jgi:Pyruvate/2-oxoacid:ferredoxin oxidoreductase delta subunit
MLKDLLESKKCVKLICGAGNDDLESISKLVYVYLHAGVRLFDVSANVEVVRLVKKLIREMGVEAYVVVSYGIKGDPHADKAFIKEGCTSCGVCRNACTQNAIYTLYGLNGAEVNKDLCIGCGRCAKMCKYISMVSEPKSIADTLPELIKEGVDSIEFHISNKGDDILERWKEITSLFDGIISICIDRSVRGDKELIDTINELIKDRPAYSFIIQADGAPMSGLDDAPSTTLQALATAQIVERAKLPVYLLLSGGTNKETSRLAKEFRLDYNGISLGSYARKVIKNYVEHPDFWTSLSVQEGAFLVAQDLVDTTVSYMRWAW